MSIAVPSSPNNGNTLEFVDLVKGIYTYKYSKSKTKKGELLKLTEMELQKLLRVNA